MRALLTAVSLLVSMGTAAAFECAGGGDRILKLQAWEAKRGASSVDVTLTLKNEAPKGIRMIKGSVHFEDPFGGSVANLALDPDMKIEVSGIHKETGNWFAERLAKVNPSDVTTSVCLTGVVYADGTKEEFK